MYKRQISYDAIFPAANTQRSVKHSGDKFTAKAEMQISDGSIAEAAAFAAPDQQYCISEAKLASVRHGVDIAHSIRVWSRDPVQPASRAVLHAGYASALLLQGQILNAMSQWRTSLQILPSFIGARYNLACALLHLAKESSQLTDTDPQPEQEAISHLQAILQQVPEPVSYTHLTLPTKA